MSSAAKCCASAAEPPLPQASALPPLRRQSASSAPARATGPANDCDAANLRFALSAKCAATRAESAAFCSACPMFSILLEVHLELDATRRIGMGREAADARAQRLAAVQAPCERRIFAPRHVAQLAAAPRDTHGAGIMRIVRLATQLEGVAHPQDRKSTRLNSSHSSISYAVFCL